MINLALIPLIALAWIFPPFLARNLKSSPHIILRSISVGFAIAGSGIILFSSVELTKLKPKMDSLRKKESSEFKHSLASDLLVATSTNSAIAQMLIGERQSELILPEPLSSEEFRSSEPLNDDGSLVLNHPEPNEPTEPQLRELPFFDDVIEALEDGEISDSKIIKDVMGFKNVKYQEGRKILERIKGIYYENNQ